MPYIVELPDGRRVEFPDSVSKDQASQIIREQFFTEEPERTLGGYAKEALKGIIPGAAGLAETAITGAAAILPEEAEQAVRRRVSSVVEPIREAFAPAPGYEDTAVRKLSEAVGSTLPFLPLGIAGAIGRGAAVGLGVAAGAGEARQRAEEAGATEGERGLATALGIGPGALEALPPIRILRRFGFGDEAIEEVAGFFPALRRAAQAGGEEALQEASSQVLQNLIAKGVYAPDEAVFGGVGEAAALGGGAGAIVSAIADLALGRRLRRPEETAPEEPAPEETVTEPPPETRTEVTPPAPPTTPPAEPVDQLLAEFEEAPVEDEAARTKFEETVAKIKAAPEETVTKIKPEQAVDLDNALNIARTRVQQTGKTAAPYIQNAVNAYRPEGMPKITLEQAKQIRQQLVNEGIITGKDKVKKAELPAATETPKPQAAQLTVPRVSAGEPDYISQRIIQSGAGSDFVRGLYEPDPQDATATNLDLDEVPSKNDILQSREYIKNVSQNLLKQEFGDEITLYRGLKGTEDKSPVLSYSLDKATAQFNAEQQGIRTGQIEEIKVPVSEILSYSEAIGKGTFAEAEVIIPASIRNKAQPAIITPPPPSTETKPAEETQVEEEVVSYEDLERQQIEAATKDLEEEVEDVSAPADATTVVETKPKRRRKGAEAPVSGGPLTPSGAAAAAEQKVGEAVAGGMDVTSDTADTITAGEGRESAPLKVESAANPLETYQSLMRRLEGLRRAKRIDIFNFNRISTQLRRGNPVTNPEGYAEVQREADELLNQYETAAEAREAEDTAQGIDQRERQLKDQERVALERAQRKIVQDKVAESLRTQFDRGLAEEEVLPQQARKIRDALEGNDIKSATQMLVQPAAAVETYPKSAEKFRPLFTAIARKLNDVDFSNVKVQTEATPGADLEVFKRLKDEFKNAEFDPATNTLYVRRDRAYSTTIQHELIHAGTVETIREYEVDKLEARLKEAEAALAAAKGEKETEKAKARVEQVKNQQLGVRRLMATYELVQTQADDISLMREFPNAFENMYEFIAVGLTNPQFQSRLAQIEVALPTRRVNLWTEFVEAISKLFGLDVKSDGTTTALNELGQAFSEILAAPTSEGVTGVAPLAEKERKKAEKEPKPEINPYEESSKQFDTIQGNRLTLKGLVEHLTSAKSVENLVEKYQDEQRPLLRQQTDLDRAGLAIWAAAKDGGNTLAAANDESAGLYQNNETVVAPLIQNNNKAVNAYAARKGITYNDAVKRLDTFFMAEAIDVRRLTNYLKQKPLSTKPTLRLKGAKDKISPAQLRDKLIDSVLTTEVLSDARRDAIHARLMQLAGVEIGPDGKVRRTADAAKYEDALGASYNQIDREGKPRKPGPRDLNYDSPAYDIIAGWSVRVNDGVLNDLKNEMSKFGNEINAIRKSLVDLDKITMKFNEEANYLTQPAKNLIKLYGWGDKYVPLMGKVSKEYKNTEGAIYSNTVPNEILPGFRTRETLPDSPILMSQINAGKAATRSARADIVPTLVNLMKPHPKTGKTYTKGKSMGTITFKQRYQNDIDYTESDGEGGRRWTGRDKFYNFLPNGDIEVWKVYDEPTVNSLRPEWTPPKGLSGRFLAASQRLTSIIGQGHTRYQLKFAIYDFPRNIFANAGAIYSEMGRENAGKYFAGVGREVFQKVRIPQIWKIANAHFNGDLAAVKKMGGFNEKTQQWKDPFVEAAYQFLERGGKVSIVRSWQTRGQLEKLIDDANKSNIRKSARRYKDALDRIFDLWLDGFELVARVEGFRVAKSYAVNQRKMNNAEAETYAVNFAKNLANFEKRGLKKLPGALYAFWNPAATGAVRAFDAIMPAMRVGFNPKNIEAVLDELPDEIKNDPQARAQYAERYQQLAKNAQGAIGAYAGVGFITYMMALSLGAAVKGLIGEDDEDPKNVVAEDSKELWTRNLRIPIEWLGVEGKFFQIPWGFGIGAFAATGAQVAALVTNGQSLKDFLGNTATIAADSYLPLPVARYNPIDSPFNWLISSIMPTYLRPFYEHNVNMSGLGQAIHRDYYNRYGPALAGSENIEEMYRYIAVNIRNATGGRYQPEPGEIRYFLTAYIDGIAAIASDFTNLGLIASGDKGFDPKTDLIILDSYIGNKISPDLVQFGRARPRIEALKRGYDSAINSPDPAYRERFLRDNPNAPLIVHVYNQQLADMRRFRQQTTAPEVFSKTPKERKELVKEFNKTRDVLMGQVANLYESYQEDIDDYYSILR